MQLIYNYLKGIGCSFPYAMYFSPIILFFKQWLMKYVFFDAVLIMNMVVIIIIDTLLGVYVAYKLKEVSSNSFGKVFIKITLYLVLLISVHLTSHATLNGEPNAMLMWLDSTVYAAIFVRELLSIFENVAKIGIFKLPASILNKLKDFDENGTFKRD